jgi:hypothetical protein
MKLRRGMTFALIHLVIAIPVLLLLEARDARTVYGDAETEPRPLPAPPPPPPPPPSLDDTETVTFDMCGGWAHFPPQQVLMSTINLPAITVAGWRDICPAHWTLAGHMVNRVWWTGREEMLFRQRRLDIEVLGLIALQWFLMGSFPLSHPRRAWLEPGAFITVCAVTGFAFAILPYIDPLAILPALFAYIAWLVWAVLLLTLPIRLLWRRICQGRTS